MSQITYNWPQAMPHSKDYKVTLDGKPVEVLYSSIGSFINFSTTGPVEVKVELPKKTSQATIRPLKHNIEAELELDVMTFTIPGACQLVCEINGCPDLFIFADEPETDIPDLEADNVTVFAAGQWYEIDNYMASPGETIYIAGGAVVSGAINIKEADGVKVCGRGIINNIHLTRESGKATHPWYAVKSNDLVLEGVTIIESQTWTAKASVCKNVLIKNIKVITNLVASDGIDISASEDVVVSGCFVRAGDDCLAVKSVEYGCRKFGYEPEDVCKDVKNIRFENCVLLNYSGGSAMELGHEFRCGSVKNIYWKDIDVLGVHSFGSAFSIRNCDGALIENITYEDIRVEHHYNELIGFRLIKSKYSRSEERGRIKNILFKDIKITVTPHNLGYSLSHIGGYDKDHNIDGVVFDNFIYGDEKATSLDDFDCYTKYTTNISFK